VLQILIERVASTFRRATAEGALWLGHRVWIIDGTGVATADVPELQGRFGQPSGQRPGCGFPIAHLVALTDLATGMLLRVAVGPSRAHDMSQAGRLAAEYEPGDVVLGDRGFCSYGHIAMLLARGCHAVFRMHQKQLVDFTPGRPMPTRRSCGANPGGLPHSLWVRSNGPLDQVVVWYKPKQKPRWMTDREFADLPAEITVRELRYDVAARGFRTQVVTLATTLLDPEGYPKAELAELYRRRWRIELNFRHIKITMKMDVLRCKTVEGVMKELAVFALAYNLVRSVTFESARRLGVAVERLGFLDALRWLTNPIPGGRLSDILINPLRPDRVDPRVIKRRMKQFPLMQEPRAVLRNRLLGNGLTS
jgi:hypothetical protein